MSESCRNYREDIGVYVLGQLAADRRAALTAHLDACPDCRAEAEELAAVARLLPAADPLRGRDRPTPPPHLGEVIVDAVEFERRARRRRLRRRVAGGLAAAALIVAGLFAYQASDPNRPRMALEFTRAPAGVSSAIGLEYFSWGTRIDLDIDGLPTDQPYTVWMERDDGSRVAAGTFWTPDSGNVDVTMTAAIRFRDCKGIGVSNDSGDTILWTEMKWRGTDDAAPYRHRVPDRFSRVM
jgi:Putative zinc-finger